MASLSSPVFDRDGYSFKAMWEQAQVRFQDRTAKSLKSATGKSLEDVLKELEERYPEDNIFEAKNGSQSNVKDIVRNVLNCINILGGIVAQGASMAFGGAADICYSAVSFLIEMHARIDRLYEGLAQLFEEISTFLKTFKIYKRVEKFAEVDPELKAITGRLMISFVDICALSIKLLNGSKWRKFKTVLKVALMDDDSGIRAELDKFKGLIDQSSRISDAVTLEKVMVSHHEVVQLLQNASERSGQQLLYLEGISSGVNVLKADINEHKTQRLHSDQIQELMKKLSINQETAKFSMRYLDDVRTTPIPNSGLWLKDVEEYHSWADNTSTKTNSLLFLYGGEKSGKSFLIGSILDELDFQFREGRKAESRASVAYYCFSKLDKKLEASKSIKNPQLPATALKSMAVRIAEQNISYSKEMSTFWATKKATDHANMSFHELWTALQLSVPKADTMHYLIFDGLEVLAESDACELFDVLLSVQNPRVRILAASDEAILDASLDSMRDRFTEAIIPSIHIELSNGLDIGLFIDAYLSQNGELFGQDVETSKLKDWLREKLPGLAKGNFYRLQTALDQFAEDYKRGQSASDIMRDLEAADLSQDPAAAAKQVVARLNRSLNSQEIDQLNELMIWTIYGWRYLEVDELRAALFLRFKSDPAQPLAAQLSGRGKYEPMFTIENNYCQLKESIQDLLMENAQWNRTEDGVGDEDKPKISMTIKIANADIQTVQRFLWDLGERAVFEKFAFENIEAKVESQKSIYAHEIEAHVSITLRCMDLLLAEPNDSSAALVEYALYFLPAHLEYLTMHVRPGGVQISETQSIVDKLINLVSDTECIEKHWTKGPNKIHFGLLAFSWWLSLSDITDSLRPRDRRWLERRDRSKNPKTSCLSDIASMVAEQWLRHRDWKDPDECARWIYDYIIMEANGDVTFEYPTGTTILDQEHTFMDETKILQAADWVEDELKVRSKDSLWFERLGYTFLAFGYNDEAIAAFIQSKDLPDKHLRSIRGLAEAHAAKGELEPAIKAIDAMIGELRAQDKNEGALVDDKAELLSALRLQAGWNLKSEPPNLENAITLYQEILEIDARDHDSKWKLFKTLADAGLSADALELLRASSVQPAHKTGDLDRLAEMLLNLKFEDLGGLAHIETFDLVLSLTAGDPISTSILEGLKRCIELVHKENDATTLIRLLLLQGAAIFHYNPGRTEQKEAIVLWKKCCSTGFKILADVVSNLEVSHGVSLAIRRICVYYDTLARKGGHDTEEQLNELLQFYSEAQKVYWTARIVRYALAACYISSMATEKARDLLRSDMMDGLFLLSDDDPENDFQGYQTIGEAALHAGDDLNALTAWSLLLPDDIDGDEDRGGNADEEDEDEEDEDENADKEDERGHANDDDEEDGDEDADDSSSRASKNSSTSTAQSSEANDVTPNADGPTITIITQEAKVRTGKLCSLCDGGCGTRWFYADDFYCCKICCDVQFDARCLKKLREGMLKRVICSPDHDFLHIPAFSDEDYQKVGKGNVRVGGMLVDGARQGGEIVPIADWLQSLRDQWGIPKAE
ncbi:uncharacterized protein A1O9_11630 [Exophiala aquamarina CBS 119918]|uniref:Uncharacterized protein n=1 Tax=Exophiala aquamarina CBS 119918 TaxID=1182545 RepID=A0A072NX07_9EURO|nr:uncharacterized protein A1O9_11630 [Exophiala aquamarina CBS 119918]KEF52389.1 hypothetical protein A1O9_11630 [Exophiala aquamarina CBS 119918]